MNQDMSRQWVATCRSPNKLIVRNQSEAADEAIPRHRLELAGRVSSGSIAEGGV
jgi:hypothetical protein